MPGPSDDYPGKELELQVNLIVMDDNAQLTFGQYNGMKMLDATEADQGNYYFWAKKKKNPNLYLRAYICWVEARYRIDEGKGLLQHRDSERILRPEKQEQKAPRERRKPTYIAMDILRAKLQ